MNVIHRLACARHSRSQSWLRAGAALAAVSLLAACGSGDEESDAVGTTAAPVAAAAPGEAKFTVVVPDAVIADLVRQVAGPGVLVWSVVPLGANGHTYSPRPEEARTFAEADMYIENGYSLNVSVTAFASRNYPEGTPHHVLSDSIPRNEIIPRDTPEEIAAHGHAHSYHAHFWADPNYAIVFANRIAQIMSGHDPADATGYASRAATFVGQLQQMDAAFRTAIATIPEQNRKMLVYHDSWTYFGRRYGLPVIGTMRPIDFSEPSAAALRTTIDEVKAAGVPAFFGSEVFPSDVLEVIEQESGASYVADLSDDRLPGDLGSPQHSYVGMMVANVRTIVTALGGTAQALDAIDPSLL